MVTPRLLVSASLTAVAFALAGCAVYPAYPVGQGVGGYGAPYSVYQQGAPVFVAPQLGYYGNPYDGYMGGYGGYGAGYSGGYGSYYGGYAPSYFRAPGSYRHYYRDDDRRAHHRGDHEHSGPRERQDTAPTPQPGRAGETRSPGPRRDRD